VAFAQRVRDALVGRRPPYEAVPLTPPEPGAWETAWSALAGHGPNVVGATGGSGTRAVARALRAAGMFVGVDLNRSEDAVQFAAFSDRWIDRYVRGEARRDPRVDAEMTRQLRALVLHHTVDRHGGQAWGWKEPRSIYLLPFLAEQLPGLRFLHVVRDGRDMAYSANRVQLRKHGDAVLGAGGGPAESRAIALWNDVNLRAADYGERELGERYLRVRFEDLCAEPAMVLGRVFGFFGLAADAGRIAAETIQTPETIGRWREQPPEAAAALEERARDGLARFGYHSSSR
jgi:hypothetical protein